MENKKWFETWFNSPYYHILYANRNHEEAESFIRKLFHFLQLPTGAEVLDIACGKGRHAMVMSDLGYNATGVDLAKNSILEANKHSTATLSFDVHDMREVYKQNQFSGVFNLFTSLGYFENTEDNQKSITAMAEAAEKDGVVVVDFMNVHKVIANLVEKETKLASGVTFQITREVKDNWIIKTIQFSDQGKSYTFQEKVYAIDLDYLTQMMQKANLEVESVFGDYNLNPLDIENSNRLIIVARKK